LLAQSSIPTCYIRASRLEMCQQTRHSGQGQQISFGASEYKLAAGFLQSKKESLGLSVSP
jgi:hypothetical protein